MQPFTHLDLCSGIGGFALAARAVWGDRHHLLAFCEIDPYCGSILAKHWPDTPLIQNIFDLDGTQFPRPDLLTAGFPCQPYSVAGKRKGARDDRDLWPQVFRVVQESRPRWCCFENVAGFLLMGFDRTKVDMESEGYEVGEPLVIPACAVDAPHRRDRVWIIAHLSDTDGDGESQCEGVVEGQWRRIGDGRETVASDTAGGVLRQERGSVAGGVGGSDEQSPIDGEGSIRRSPSRPCRTNLQALPNPNRRRRKQQDPSLGEPQQPDPNRAEPLLNATSAGCEERVTPSGGDPATLGSADGGDAIASHWRTPLVVEGYRIPPPESGIRVLAHGVSGRVARLKALGNAIVPEVAIEIFRAIRGVDDGN